MNSYLKDLRKKKPEELAEELLKKQGELRDFRFGIAGSKTKNTKTGRTVRKEIARIKTVMNSRGN